MSGSQLFTLAVRVAWTVALGLSLAALAHESDVAIEHRFTGYALAVMFAIFVATAIDATVRRRRRLKPPPP